MGLTAESPLAILTLGVAASLDLTPPSVGGFSLDGSGAKSPLAMLMVDVSAFPDLIPPSVLVGGFSLDGSVAESPLVMVIVGVSASPDLIPPKVLLVAEACVRLLKGELQLREGFDPGPIVRSSPLLTGKLEFLSRKQKGNN